MLGVLSVLADALAAAPRAKKADALGQLTPVLTELDRVAALLELRK